VLATARRAAIVAACLALLICGANAQQKDTPLTEALMNTKQPLSAAALVYLYGQFLKTGWTDTLNAEAIHKATPKKTKSTSYREHKRPAKAPPAPQIVHCYTFDCFMNWLEARVK
jgi:hypothetical protein